MANGKPGDHPLTDILDHGASDFPDDIKTLVLSISQQDGFDSVRDRVANILWDHWPHWQNVTPNMPKVRDELIAIQKALTDHGTR